MNTSTEQTSSSESLTTRDFVTALIDEAENFSNQGRKLADTVLADVSFATNASISEIAERAGVSPPTVTRFCRQLGCSSFAEFKVQLAKSTFVGLRYLKPESMTSTPEEVADDIISKAQNALFEMQRQLNFEKLGKVADLLSKAQYIHAFGSGGNSTMVVNELQNRLFRLGKHIQTSNDYTINLMLSAATKPDTVVVGSSQSGRNADLVRCFNILRSKGVTTIALTKSDSPLEAVADIAITVSLPEGQNIFRPTSTRFAYLAIVDIIANLVAYADRTTSANVLREIKAELIRYRDEDDSQLLGD